MEERTIRVNGKEVTLEREKDSGEYDGVFSIEIVLRKLRNAQSYEDVRRVLDDSFSDSKREDVPKIVERLKAFDKKGIGCAFGDPIRYAQIVDWLDRWGKGDVPECEKMFFEVLSPYIPKESLDLLFSQLEVIRAMDLCKIWFKNPKYRLWKNFGQREFFKLCSDVVPHRKGQVGWSESSFYKEVQKGV